MQKKTMLMAGTKEMMTGVKLTQALNPKACISALKSSLTGKVLSVKKLVYSTSSAPMDIANYWYEPQLCVPRYIGCGLGV
jgi:hypothetical protein